MSIQNAQTLINARKLKSKSLPVFDWFHWSIVYCDGLQNSVNLQECDSLFSFLNEEIFVQLDELNELDKINHTWT